LHDGRTEPGRSMSTLEKGGSGAGPPDFVTVATTADGKLMTKVCFVDSAGREQTRSYDKGYLFNFSMQPIGSLDDLARVLDGLGRHSCVIYGRLIEGTAMPCRRLLTDKETGDLATIEDAPHRWVLLDIDKLAIEGEAFDPVGEPERAVEYILAKLPSEFHGARCLWRLTSSAGVEKGATISMRLGFWLDRPLTGAEAKAWLGGTIVDCAIYTANQVIYAATPIFKDDRTDPVGRRSGIVEGAPIIVPPPINIATRVSGIPGGPGAKASIAPRSAPEGINWDTEAAIAAGRDCIKRALASNEWNETQRGTPTPTGARAYKLATRLKDEALSPEKIVYLLVEMVPGFDEEDRPLIVETVENAFRHGQNDPGCGPLNDVMRLFGAIPDTEIKVDEELGSGAWAADPRLEGDDRTPPIDIFGDVAFTGQPAFPIEALPQVLEDFVTDRAERLGVDPAMIAMPALVACAAVLDDRHKVQVRQHDQQFVQSARLWVALIEEPGGKKTPALHAAIEPLHDLEAEWSKEDAPKFDNFKLQMLLYKRRLKQLDGTSSVNALLSGLSEPQKPPGRRLVVSDATTEAFAHVLADNPAGVIAEYDELAQLWGSFDTYHAGKGPGRDRPLWLQLYDGGPRSIDRVSYGHLEVPNWAASIVGGIQPERLSQISRNLAEDGMLQRFMIVFGSGPSLGIDREANEEADRAYRGILQTIAAWRDLPPARVTLSPAADDARERVMQRVLLLLRVPETPAALKNHLNKWEGLFARLALTMHAVTVAGFERAFSTYSSSPGLAAAPEISGEIGRCVEKLMLEYLLPTALRFYSKFFGRPEHVKHACWVADHILARELQSISGRDVGRAYNELRDDPQALEHAMSYLETAGWIVPKNGSNSKRPSRWLVDPRVHQIFSERAKAERLRRDREMEDIRQAQAKLREAA